jgi:glycosyltransferase involved in cell wall biosynthesis
MRQLHVIPYYAPATQFGGVQTVCHRLAEAMAARGHEVTVLTTDVASRSARLAEPRSRRNGVDVVRVRNWSQALVRANLYTPRDFRRRAAELIATHDFVHVHDVFNWLTYVAIDQAARLGKPSLLSSDNLLGFHGRPARVLVRRALYRLLGRPTVARATLVQALLPGELDPDALGIAPKRIRVIHNGVALPPPPGDAARFRARYGITAPIIVLFVGQLLYGKGVDLLLAAAKTLAGRGRRDLAFVFVGYAGREWQTLAGPAPPAQVITTGFLEGEALADARAAASLYVLPSRADRTPMTALEALSYGLPSLLSRDCHMPEVASAGAGLVVDATEVAVTAGLTELLERRAQWPAMSAAARQLVVDRYALDRIHDQYEQLYRELLAR